MKLIVGLGNPGEKYTKTRHNVGFDIIDFLQRQWSDFSDFREKKSFAAKVSLGRIKRRSIMLVKPLTFMNNSGLAVQNVRKFYKVPIKNILVIHDDSDLPVGNVKFSAGRGSAGHKGIDSIIEHLKSKEFTRLRIGIRPNLQIRRKAETFVLKPFNKKEQDLYFEARDRLTEIILHYFDEGFEKTKSKFAV